MQKRRSQERRFVLDDSVTKDTWDMAEISYKLKRKCLEKRKPVFPLITTLIRTGDLVENHLTISSSGIPEKRREKTNVRCARQPNKHGPIEETVVLLTGGLRSKNTGMACCQ